jgi:hypothetical protein
VRILATLATLGALSAVARADGSAQLAVETEDGARVEIDGAVAAGTVTLRAGTHAVVVTRRGRIPETRTIELGFGERRALAVPLAETDQRRVVPYVAAAGGVAAAGAITALAFALSASSRMSRIESDREASGITAAQLAEYQRAVHSRDRDSALAWGTGIGALALGATALGLYWFDERSVIVAQPTGVAVAGRF